MTTYNDYDDYIKRIAEGERNILTSYQIEHLTPKGGIRWLPQSRWGVQLFNDYNINAGFHIIGNHGLLTNGMVLNLVDNSVERLPSGVYKGNLLGRLFSTSPEEPRNLSIIISPGYCSRAMVFSGSPTA